MKTSSHIALALLSLVVSRLAFAPVDDPEGPNLLVVCVLAAAVCAACLAARSMLLPGGRGGGRLPLAW